MEVCDRKHLAPWEQAQTTAFEAPPLWRGGGFGLCGGNKDVDVGRQMLQARCCVEESKYASIP